MLNRIVVIISLVFVINGASKLYAQSVDKIVSVVGNEAILQSDIDAIYLQMKASGELPETNSRCKILKMLIDQKMLVAQAKLDSLTVDLENISNSVDRQLATYTAQFGGQKNMENYFSKTYDKIRQEMMEFNTEQTYAERMKQELTSKVLITPKEVEAFYQTIPKDSLPIVPDQYMIYQLVKKPNSEAAVIEVKEFLLSLRKRVLAGEKFQSLATIYSEDPGSARRGGEVGLSPLEGYVAPIRNVIKAMRPGQVSQIVESEYGFHIVQLIERQEANNMVNYRHILIRPKFTVADKNLGFAQLDSLVNKINADSITFENAALFFSDDEKSRAGSGLLVNAANNMSPYFFKDQLNPTDFKALEDITIGEISKPFESADLSGNMVYKVIMLKEFRQTHKANLKDDYNQIHEVFKRQKEHAAIVDWIAKQQKKEYIRLNKSYRNCDYVEASWGE